MGRRVFYCTFCYLFNNSIDADAGTRVRGGAGRDDTDCVPSGLTAHLLVAYTCQCPDECRLR